MKRYLLTAPSFPGVMILTYLEGELKIVDFTEAEIEPKQKQWMLSNTAMLETELPEMLIRAPNITCVGEDVEVTIEDFMREYPYSRNTHLIPPVWAKMNKADRVLAVTRARQYKHWGDKKKMAMPDYTPMVPVTWLKHKEYLNDWRKM